MTDAFYRAHVARHRSAANRWVVFVFDHLLVGSLLLALRRPRQALSPWAVSLVAIVLGHLLFEHNASEELDVLVKHPSDSLAAERRLLLKMWRTGPYGFNPAVD